MPPSESDWPVLFRLRRLHLARPSGTDIGARVPQSAPYYGTPHGYGYGDTYDYASGYVVRRSGGRARPGLF